MTVEQVRQLLAQTVHLRVTRDGFRDAIWPVASSLKVWSLEDHFLLAGLETRPAVRWVRLAPDATNSRDVVCRHGVWLTAFRAPVSQEPLQVTWLKSDGSSVDDALLPPIDSAVDAPVDDESWTAYAPL